MSRFNAKHAVVAAATLLAAAAVALWLWDAGNSSIGDAPTRVDAPSPPKPARVAPTKARRTKPAVATSPDAPHAALVVRVVATSNRAAIVGAAVYVTDGGGDDWRAETDADGAARFDELAVGQSTVHAEAANRMSANRAAALIAGANKDVELALDDTVAVEGSVVDAESGVALSGATVQLVASGANDRPDRPLDETTTDAAGRFRFARAPAAGVVRVRVTASDHAHGLVTTALPASGGGTPRIDVRLDRTGTLRGVVRDPYGRPADGAWVHVAWKSAPASEGFDALTDDGGAFVLHGIPIRSDLAMTAGAPEWGDSAPVDAPTLAKSALDATIDLALRRTATLVVRVHDPSGGVVADADVSIDGRVQSASFSNAAGALVRKGLAPGPHHLVAQWGEYPPTQRDVTLDEGAPSEIDLQLSVGVSISGFVVDDAGVPIANASVAPAGTGASQGPKVRGGTTTAADGAFRIDGVASGRHGFVVSVVGMEPLAQQIEAPAEGVRIVVPSPSRVTLRFVVPPGAPSPTAINVRALVGGQSTFIGMDRIGSSGGGASTWLRDSVVRCAVPRNATGLLVRIDLYAPLLVPIRPEPGRELDLGTVRFDIGVALRGRVVDGDGRAVPGAAVRCWTSGMTGAPIRAEDDGSFVVPQAAHGRAVLHASAESRRGASVVDVVDETTSVTIVARRMGVLHVAAADAAGAPIKYAVVAVRHDIADATDDGVTENGSTDALGAFAAAVAAGRCRVVLGESSAEADVPEGGEATVRLVVQSR